MIDASRPQEFPVLAESPPGGAEQKWRLSDVAYDPKVHKLTPELLVAIRSKLKDYPESVIDRFTAAEAVINMVEAGDPERFADTALSKELEGEVYQALKYVNDLTYEQLAGELKQLASTVAETMPGPFEGINAAFDQGLISSDTRRLGEGIVRYLMVNEAGLGSQLPEPQKGRSGV